MPQRSIPRPAAARRQGRGGDRAVRLSDRSRGAAEARRARIGCGSGATRLCAGRNAQPTLPRRGARRGRRPHRTADPRRTRRPLPARRGAPRAQRSARRRRCCPGGPRPRWDLGRGANEPPRTAPTSGECAGGRWGPRGARRRRRAGRRGGREAGRANPGAGSTSASTKAMTGRCAARQPVSRAEPGPWDRSWRNRRAPPLRTAAAVPGGSTEPSSTTMTSPTRPSAPRVSASSATSPRKGMTTETSSGPYGRLAPSGRGWASPPSSRRRASR